MHDIDRRKFEMLNRVRDFGATYGQLFAEDTLAGQAFATIATALGDIKAQDVAETVAFVSARAAQKDQVRRALKDQLLLISRTARVLPGVDANLKAHLEVPENASDQVLVTTAQQMAQQVVPLTSEFVAHGMPKSFVADFQKLIAQFDGAVRERGMSHSQLNAARAGIKEAMDTAFTAVRQLDVIVANHLASNATVKRLWKQSRRIRYPAPRVEAESGNGEETAAPLATMPVPPATM